MKNGETHTVFSPKIIIYINQKMPNVMAYFILFILRHFEG